MRTILLVVLILLLWGAAHLALQRGLGILSERWFRLGIADRCDIGSYGPFMKRHHLQEPFVIGGR